MSGSNTLIFNQENPEKDNQTVENRAKERQQCQTKVMISEQCGTIRRTAVSNFRKILRNNLI